PERARAVAAAEAERRIPRDRPGGGRRSRTSETFAQAVQRLSRDPSLRATEPGRMLLRMLVTTEMDPAQWEWIAVTVPPHRARMIQAIALKRSEEWNRLADLVGRRTRELA
ncbi:MAG TPA: hypothetical protein VHJ17_15465, partial [Thermomonospora sp.]|nr:hypothetical protein [Thermomonospora sp.]